MLTLTYFTARSNLVSYAFVWKDGKTIDFSETIVVYDIKAGRCSYLNEYMSLYKYKRSRSFIDLVPRSLRLNIFKLILCNFVVYTAGLFVFYPSRALCPRVSSFLLTL